MPRHSNDNAKKALAEINSIAKGLRNDNPSMKWVDALKEAGKIYRKNHGLPDKKPRVKKGKMKKVEEVAMQ